MKQQQALKEEYIRGALSCRALAEKYGLEAGALQRRAWKEGWRELRLQYRRREEETRQEKKTAPPATGEEGRLQEQRRANRLFARFLLDILQQEQLRQAYLPDGRGLKDYMAALSANEQLQRRLYDLPTRLEAERLAVEKEKLRKRSAGEEESLPASITVEFTGGEDYAG